eukprot:1149759-Pelagomonas_calceolata.AAC.4
MFRTTWANSEKETKAGVHSFSSISLPPVPQNRAVLGRIERKEKENNRKNTSEEEKKRNVYAGHRPALRKGPLTSKLARASPEAEEFVPKSMKEKDTRWLKRALSPLHHRAGKRRASVDLEGC